MVADFVQDSGSDLLDEIRLALGDLLDGILEDVDDIRQRAGILDAAPSARAAVIKTQQQVSAACANGAKLTLTGTIANFDRDFVEVARKCFGHICQGVLDELAEALLAHVVGQDRIPRA